MDGRIRNEIDLSIRNRSRNMLQFPVHDNQVRNTMNGSRSNVMVSESTERLSLGLPFDIQDRNTISGSRSNILNSRDLDNIQVRNTMNGSGSNIMISESTERLYSCLPFGSQVRNTISGSRSNVFASKDLNDVWVRNTLSGSRLNINETYDYNREDNLERVLVQQGEQDNIVHGAKILESGEIGSNLTVNENTREINIEFTDEPGFVDPRDLAWRKYQSDLQRSELNLLHHENLKVVRQMIHR